jgi:hypothetical protein
MNEDTYQRFDSKTPDEVRALIEEIGHDTDTYPLEDSQNSSPTMGEMLRLCELWPGSTLEGYTISKPREDYRVSADAIHLFSEKLSLGFVQEVLNLTTGADEADIYVANGGYKARIWWD